MPLSHVGLIAGLLLTIAVVTGGLVGLLLAVVLGGGGYLLGANHEGEIDLSSLTRGRRG